MKTNEWSRSVVRFWAIVSAALLCAACSHEEVSVDIGDSMPAAAGGGVRVSTTLVINEIDYDQPGSDVAEFVELLNVSDAAVNLAIHCRFFGVIARF